MWQSDKLLSQHIYTGKGVLLMMNLKGHILHMPPSSVLADPGGPANEGGPQLKFWGPI